MLTFTLNLGPKVLIMTLIKIDSIQDKDFIISNTELVILTLAFNKREKIAKN